MSTENDVRQCQQKLDLTKLFEGVDDDHLCTIDDDDDDKETKLKNIANARNHRKKKHSI